MNNRMPTNKAAISWITRTLAVMAALCVFTVCLLSFMNVQIPPELNTLAGGLVGTLGAMLVKTTPTETGTAPIDSPPEDPQPDPPEPTEPAPTP